MHLQIKTISLIFGSSAKVLIVPAPMQVHKKMGGQVEEPLTHWHINDEGILTWFVGKFGQMEHLASQS